jgi:Ca2+-binding RTX toxin-like protein
MSYDLVEIQKLYNYGTASPSDDFNERIREAEDANAVKAYNMLDYLTNGAGRYARAGLFAVVDKFFSEPTIADGTWTLADMIDYLGLNLSSAQLTISNYGTDTSSSDFALRTMIFGTAGFSLSGGATFTVSGGVRTISNLEVTADADNYDFRTNNEIVNVVAETPAEALLDPSGIGSTVFIEYYGDGRKYTTYTASNYAADIGSASSINYATEGHALDHLMDANGLTYFLTNLAANAVAPVLLDQDLGNYFEGRNVIYGTSGDDALSPLNDAVQAAGEVIISGANSLGISVPEYLDYCLVGGDGNDIIDGGAGDDILLGGDGDDYLVGWLGNDQFWGGKGNNTLDGGIGFGTDKVRYDITESGDISSLPIVISFFSSSTYVYVAGTDQTDTLINIDEVTLSAGVDTISVYSLNHFNDTLVIDAKGSGSGHDVIDLSGAAAGFKITESANGTYSFSARSGGGDDLRVTNVTPKIIGSDYGDKVTVVGDAAIINTGGGSDLIDVSSLTAQVNAGDGVDRIRVHDGQIIDGGAGNDIYDFGPESSAATIKFGAGSGNEAIMNAPGGTIVDFGALSLADISINWDITETYNSGNGFFKSLGGDFEIQLTSGDTVRLPGMSLGVGYERNYAVIDYPEYGYGEWSTTSLKYDIPDDYTFKVGGVNYNFKQLMLATGFLSIGSNDNPQTIDTIEPNGLVISGSYNSGPLLSQEGSLFTWAASYYGKTPTATPKADSGDPAAEGTSGDDVFVAAANGVVSYLNATAGVIIDLAIEEFQDTVGSGKDALVNVTNLIGSAFNDTLKAGKLAAVFTGGPGDDLISGNIGSDTAIFAGALSDYSLVRNLDGSVTVTDLVGTDGTDTLADIETAIFQGDESYVDLNSYLPIEGTENDDIITGTSSADSIHGYGGNDAITAGGGSDTIDGGDGDDTVIFAGQRSDYIFDRTETGEVWVYTNDYNQYTYLQNIEFVAFSSEAASSISAVAGDLGTEGDDTLIVGTIYADSLWGLGGNDVLFGDEGDDYIFGGDGTDQANYAGALEDYLFLWDEYGSILVVDQANGEGTDYLSDVENVHFAADSSVYSLASLLSDFGTEDDDLLLQGTEKIDHLYGFSGDDVLLGEGGDDVIDGGDGLDRASYLGNSTDYVITRNQDGSVIVVNSVGGEGSDTLWNIEAAYFAGDDTTLDLLNIPLEIAGTSSADEIWGTQGKDIISALAGDDTINAGGGDDTIHGGDGTDVANFTGVFSDYAITDNLDGTVTIADLIANDGTDTVDGVENLYFAGDNASLTLANAIFLANGGAIEQTGTADSDWLEGGNFSDGLYGLNGDDVLFGHRGNDQLFGGAGNDTAYYSGYFSDFAFVENSDGTVTVTDQVGDEGSDTLDSVEHLFFQGDSSEIDTADALELYSTGFIETVGTSGNDIIYGTDWNDILRGGAGNDTLQGNSGDDQLHGGDGTDTAKYLFSISTFSVVDNFDGTYNVTDLVHDNGVDTLEGIELIKFSGISEMSMQDAVAATSNNLVTEYSALIENDDSSLVFNEIHISSSATMPALYMLDF